MDHEATVIEVPAQWASIEALLNFVDELEQTLALPDDQAYLVRLVVEEFATNIVKYSYEQHKQGIIQLSCTCDEDELRVIIRDHGQPFDPNHSPEPDLSADVENRSVGGLGVFLVREMCDVLTYHHDRASGWNELVVIKKRQERTDGSA